MSNMVKRHGNAKDKCEIHCKQCKVSFYVPPCREKTAKFCSYTCKAVNLGTGRVKSKEEIEKIRIHNIGKHHSKNTEYKKGVKRPDISGENHPRWKKDRTTLKDDSKDRLGQLHREWSRTVKNRDGWKCMIANSDCGGKIEAHHILGWKDHPELRYEVNNGISLCHFHHPRKRNDEMKLIPTFMELVKVNYFV